MIRMLVLYGTTDGHTAKVARSLEETFRTREIDVDVIEAGRSAPRAAEYDAVVVAASVHAGHHQQAVAHWVRENVSALNRRPTAFVSVSLSILQEPPKGPQAATADVSGFLMATGWKPTLSKSVAGALLYTKYSWLKRWMMKQIAARQRGDVDTSRDYEYTDWIELRAFACQFKQIVESVATHTTAAA